MAKSKTSIQEDVTKTILAHLEAGTPPWRCPWSDTGIGGLPLRVTGEPYRGINVLLLWQAAATRGYGARHWMTYRQASALGGQVRRGERGVTIVKVGVVEKADGDDVHDVHRFTYMRAYRVFNVTQIDGLDPSWHRQPETDADVGPTRDKRIEAWFERTGLRMESPPSRSILRRPARCDSHATAEDL